MFQRENPQEPLRDSARGRPVSGAVQTVLGEVHDATKPLEERLRESEERFRRLVEVSAQAVWVADARGEPDMESPSCRVSTGQTFQRPMGGNWLDTVHPEDRQRVAHAWQQAVQTGARYQTEYRQMHKTGEYRLVLSRAAPVLNLDGTVREWVGMNLDIADRKRTEQELAQAIQHLNAHMDNSPLAVIEFDAQLLVTRWSKEAEKVFGWTAAEVLGCFMYDIPWVHDEDLGRVRRASQGMRDGTGPRNVSKNRNYRKDGSVIHCEWYNSAIYDNQGNLSSILSQVLDVTDRRRSEERLREAQKIESIGLLAAGLAHDFNNLLVGVVGNASLATKLLAPGSPVDDLLRRIINSGQQAAHLTKQMLAYSGKGQFVVEPIDLSDVVKEVTDLVKSTAPKKIAIQLDLETGLSAIEADRSQIHQVLMNLVINATEAIGNEAGLISVQTGIQEIDRSLIDELKNADISPGRYVFLEVRDSGCGMDEPTKLKIFDPFFTTKFLGRGLGLAAVAGIVRAHKGAIRIRSAPGRGTAFRVVFPATDSKPAQRAQYASVEAQKYRRIEGTILVVDDEESVRNMAKIALETHGCAVLTAGSGSEASTILKQNEDEFSLVILDLSMPVMSGADVLPKLLAIRPGLNVMISSGYAEAEAMSLFTGMPVAGFIQKPYTVQQLMAQVDRVRDRKHN